MSQKILALPPMCSLPGAFVLRRRLYLLAQLLRRSQGPIGIAQQFPRQQHHIRLAGAEEVIGLLWGRNQPHRPGQDTGLATDPFGKGGLVSRTERDGHARDHASGGAIDEIHPQRLELTGELNRLFDVPAALDPIRRGDTDKQRKLLRPAATDRLRNLAQQTGPIVEIASIAILSPIGERGVERVKEIAMGRMDLDHTEPGGKRPLRRPAERLHHLGDASLIQRFRRLIVAIESERARSDNGLPSSLSLRDRLAALPGAGSARLAARMRQLDAGDAALLMDKMGDTREGLGMAVVVDPQVIRADPSPRLDRGGL